MRSRVRSLGIAKTATSPDFRTVTVVAATGLEAGAAQKDLPGVRVVEGGVSLARIDPAALGEIVITCGIAGALAPDLPTGSVVIPDHVLRPDGTLLECDNELVNALDAAARALGHEPARGALVTSRDLITGSARGAWARRGYVAVDMETGLVRAPRVASVRVVLDTPDRELSDAWLHPWSVLARPDAWGQIMWVAREAPRCARLAAAVLAEAVKQAELAP
jgi:hypothetical protein